MNHDDDASVRRYKLGDAIVVIVVIELIGGYLHAYLDGSGIGGDPKGPLYLTVGRGTGQLRTTPLPQANVYAMVRRRALAAGIATKIGNHMFRATGITASLKNGGTLENAAAMANHASTRTTQLYASAPERDQRRRDRANLSVNGESTLNFHCGPQFAENRSFGHASRTALHGRLLPVCNLT
jgi:integrase